MLGKGDKKVLSICCVLLGISKLSYGGADSPSSVLELASQLSTAAEGEMPRQTAVTRPPALSCVAKIHVRLAQQAVGHFDVFLQPCAGFGSGHMAVRLDHGLRFAIVLADVSELLIPEDQLQHGLGIVRILVQKTSAEF